MTFCRPMFLADLFNNEEMTSLDYEIINLNKYNYFSDGVVTRLGSRVIVNSM